jgi:putative transposase
MSIPPRVAHSGTFLISTPTFHRRRLFQVIANADMFVETLRHYRREGHYLLSAFVVMPEHVHFIVTPQNASLERVVGLIKGGFSHRLHSKLPVWQKGFSDRRLRDEDELEIAKRYVHENPVRKRICERVEEYKWSSAWEGYHRGSF